MHHNAKALYHHAEWKEPWEGVKWPKFVANQGVCGQSVERVKDFVEKQETRRPAHQMPACPYAGKAEGLEATEALGARRPSNLN